MVKMQIKMSNNLKPTNNLNFYMSYVFGDCFVKYNTS